MSGPPREGAFVKFAQLIADAAAKGEGVPTRDELCEYFKELNWHDETWCQWYADAYTWLVRAFLYQNGIFDLCPFTIMRSVSMEMAAAVRWTMKTSPRARSNA